MNEDEFYMRKAISLALKSYANNEVPVGAIIVKNDIIIGEGNNQMEERKNPLYHAELLAINSACSKIKAWRLSDCTMYVTLSPCMMCLGGILNSRISRIVIGVKNNNFDSLSYLQDKIKITKFVYEKECSQLISSFFKSKRL